MKAKRFILSGGGTGGHIYPAIAIANELKRRFPDAEFLFVGASDKMEMQKVPQAGYKIEGLWIAGIQRKITWQNAMFPVKLLSSLLRARIIIRRFKPDVAIGTGGFASGPLLQVAGLAGIPTLVQEQNSYPGITNKMLAKKAGKICVAYEGLERFFPKDKIVLTGNPVRQDLIASGVSREEARKAFDLDPTRKTLLVLGGSLGARRINQLVADNLEFFANAGIQVLWQCGKLYYDQYAHHGDLPNVRVLAFIDRMDHAYGAADFVISRAGASSVSELCLVGKPVIFIPSPNVAEDHQTKNAKAIADKGGAILLRESELNQFQPTFSELAGDEKWQADLSQIISTLAKPDATRHIVDEIEKLLKK